MRFSPDTIGGLSGTALASSVALAGLGLAIAMGVGGPVRESLGLAPPRRRLGPAGLGLAVLGTLTLSHGLDLALTAIGAREASALGRIEEVLAGAPESALVGAVLAMAVAPALGEEMLFRGVLLKQFARRMGAFPGLALSSLLFGVIHLDLAQGAAAAILGLYLGALALRTGSIHATILCHGVNNLVAIIGARSGP